MAKFLTAHQVMLLHSPQGPKVASTQALLAATGKHLCDVAATHFFVGFVPGLNSALQIHKCVKEVKGAEEAPKIQSE